MRRLDDAIYAGLGHDAWGDGQPGAPADHLSMRLGPTDRDANGETVPIYVIQTSEDAFSFWIGTDDKWYWHCDRQDARRLAWFVLWTWWGRGEWFGLRRWLWFGALRRIVARTQRSVR